MPMTCHCGQPAARVTGDLIQCECCYLLARDTPYDHNPDWDCDYTTGRFGSDDGKEEARIGVVEVEIRRGVSLKARAVDEAGWRHAELVFVDKSVQAHFNGMSAADLENLAKFLTDYAHRLRNY